MSASQWTARPRPMSNVQTQPVENRCDRCRRAMYAVPIEGHLRGPFCKGCDELAPRDCWCPPVLEPA